MTLREQQSLFAQLVARLILKAAEAGYEVTFGEAWRTPEQALLNHRKGTGTVNSLHLSRLAIDLNLFKAGKWLAATEDHRALGLWWEHQHPSCRWGGRFNDGNHYSFTPDGVRA